ncbi:hypothetical protein [Pantoea dispersa]|uniref:hypothetical protein n=1 Tax=Pantoea dispersa TaxID=59814 RepID=UPI000F67D9CF|nr:hypothetical protein [Pantoea dispersa]
MMKQYLALVTHRIDLVKTCRSLSFCESAAIFFQTQQLGDKRTGERKLRFVALASDNNHVNSAAQNVLFAVVSDKAVNAAILTIISRDGKHRIDLLHSILVAASQGR